MPTFTTWKGLLEHLLTKYRTTEYGLGKMCEINPANLYRLSRGDTKNPQLSVIRRLEDGLKIRIVTTDSGLHYEAAKTNEEHPNAPRIDATAVAALVVQSIKTQAGHADISDVKLQHIRTIVAELVTAAFMD